MKLMSRKTKKAIEKTVRKALKKAGPALAAAIVSSLGSSLATLASTESPDKPGKSNLGEMATRARKAVVGPAPRKLAKRRRRRDEDESAPDSEGAQPASANGEMAALPPT